MRSALSAARMIAGGGLLVWGSLGPFGCAAGKGPQTTTDLPANPTSSVADDTIRGTGTIRYVDLEGGFYGLVAEDGTKYDPSPLSDSLREDDLRIRFRVQKKDVMTTRMWGTPVEVLGAERVDSENE